MAVSSTEEFMVEVELLTDLDVDVVGLFLDRVAPESWRQSAFNEQENSK